MPKAVLTARLNKERRNSQPSSLRLSTLLANRCSPCASKTTSLVPRRQPLLCRKGNLTCAAKAITLVPRRQPHLCREGNLTCAAKATTLVPRRQPRFRDNRHYGSQAHVSYAQPSLPSADTANVKQQAIRYKGFSQKGCGGWVFEKFVCKTVNRE